jgi:hypothetical protein
MEDKQVIRISAASLSDIYVVAFYDSRWNARLPSQEVSVIASFLESPVT